MVAVAFTIGATPLRAEGFRIETKVFVGDEERSR